MRGLIDEMLLLAALDRGEIATGEQADAGAAAEAVVADRRARRTWRSRDLRFVAARGLRVPVAPRLLEVVLGNLLDNALLHAGADAVVSVDVHASPAARSRSPSATPASASRPSTCRTCSSASTAPRRRARARARASASPS